MGMQGRNMIHQMDVSTSTYKRTHRIENVSFVAYDRHLLALLVSLSHQILEMNPMVQDYLSFPSCHKTEQGACSLC